MKLKFLSKFITRKRRGGEAVKKQFFETDIIAIGRGSNCDINLPDPRVQLEHARITNRAGGWYVERLGSAVIAVNEKDIQSVKINIGDVIRVGPYTVSINQGSEGADLSFDIELVNPLGDDLEELAARSEINVSSIGFSKRTWSWLFFFSVFFAILVVPVIISMNVEREPGGPMGSISKDQADYPLATWSSGEISSAHKFFAKDCVSCHAEPFMQVQDSACLSCHETIQHHADPVAFQEASFEGQACQSCHKEHQGNDAVIKSDQAFCASCHGTMEVDFPNSTLGIAADFGVSHPQFVPTLLNASSGEVTRLQAMGDNPAPKERSGLIFPHSDHVKLSGIRHPDKGIINLGCGDCHVEDDGAVSMLPVSFEANCHECHSLEFDSNLPGRELMHGEPDVVVEQIYDIYAAIALRGGYANDDAPAEVRRRPGTALTEFEQKKALIWAEEKAKIISNGPLGKGRCAECHVIAEGDNIATPWTIANVDVSTHWFPKAVFDHGSHENMDCVSCHSAMESETAEDVLMPTIEVCHSCHGGEDSEDMVPSTCISCHGFHNEDLLPMSNFISGS
jgi:predicted CXXCH cytochrome family protein